MTNPSPIPLNSDKPKREPMMEWSHVWSERRRKCRKFASTIKILFCLGMARTFGEYRHSVWDGGIDYAVYRWRGKWWAIPTTPIDDDRGAAA